VISRRGEVLRIAVAADGDVELTVRLYMAIGGNHGVLSIPFTSKGWAPYKGRIKIGTEVMVSVEPLEVASG
jgi:hypothetical protein